MTSTYERIKQDIRSLDPDEVNALLRDLQNEYTFPPLDDEEASIQAEWNTEIDQRMTDVIDGRVELISGEESESRIDALFAKFGVQRLKA